METKQLYVRDGRRFVKLPTIMDQHTTTKVGMYYNKDGSFSKEIIGSSIGVCVIDDTEKVTIAALKASSTCMNHTDAIKWCKTQFDGSGHAPTRLEMLAAYYQKDKFPAANECWCWTDEEFVGHDACYCWILFWGDGGTGIDNAYNTYYVRPFLTIVKHSTLTSRKGMYYNFDGSFTKEKTQFSIGLCINEDVKTISIVRLNYYQGVNWISAKNWAEAQFNGKGHLPSRLEGAQIIEFHEKLHMFEQV